MKIYIAKLYREIFTIDKERLRSAWNENRNDSIFIESFATNELIESIVCLDFDKKKQKIICENPDTSIPKRDLGIVTFVGFTESPSDYFFVKKIDAAKNGDLLFTTTTAKISVENK